MVNEGALALILTALFSLGLTVIVGIIVAIVAAIWRSERSQQPPRQPHALLDSTRSLDARLAEIDRLEGEGRLSAMGAAELRRRAQQDE